MPRPMTMEEIDEAYEEHTRERGLDEILSSMTVETAEREHQHFMGDFADDE